MTRVKHRRLAREENPHVSNSLPTNQGGTSGRSLCNAKGQAEQACRVISLDL